MNFTLIKSYEGTKIAFTRGAATLHLQFICYVHCNFEKKSRANVILRRLTTMKHYNVHAESAISKHCRQSFFVLYSSYLILQKFNTGK